jgi:hypothetical protein
VIKLCVCCWRIPVGHIQDSLQHCLQWRLLLQCGLDLGWLPHQPNAQRVSNAGSLIGV